MIFQPSPEQRAQAEVALQIIEAARQRLVSTPPPERDRLQGEELLPLFRQHARSLHEIVRGEVAAVTEAGEAALRPFVADAARRAEIVRAFDAPRRFACYHSGFTLSGDNVPGLLNLAVEIFREVAESGGAANNNPTDQ